MRETRNTRSRWKEILHNPQFQEQVHLVYLHTALVLFKWWHVGGAILEIQAHCSYTSFSARPGRIIPRIILLELPKLILILKLFFSSLHIHVYPFRLSSEPERVQG